MTRITLRIALIGAESTGKSTLAQAMAGRLRARGWRVAVVDEVLRRWCEQARRQPDPSEHEAIAREQERLVDAASTHADIVIADTTALMVLVYGGLLHRGSAPLLHACEALRRYDLRLLMGLDLPWVPDGLHRTGRQDQARTDALLREVLTTAHIDWRMVYGQGDERVSCALESVASVAPWAWQARELPAPRWQGVCESCADADCEHRLFRRLIDARA